MVSKRSKASPRASSSRIPVLKASKAVTRRTSPRRTSPRRTSPRRKVMMGSSGTMVLRSALQPPVAPPTGANKENIPFWRRRRSGFLPRGNKFSPSPDGKKKKPLARARAQPVKRQPLRELTEAEIFERDEAVMGDLRRRRASGDNYMVDNLGESVIFDSVFAHDTAAPEAADPSSIGAAETYVNQQPEAGSPVIAFKPKLEKFQVLRRSDSEERATTAADLQSIIEGAHKTVVDSAKRPRTRAALAAIRNSFGSNGNHSPDVMLRSAEVSPVKPGRAKASRRSSPIKQGRTRAARKSSPLSGTKLFAGITKAQASPSPLKVTRVGLGAKSANTALVTKKFFDKTSNTKEAGPAKFQKRKTVASTASTTTTTKEPKATARRANNTLKRAAGVTPGVNNAKAGLAGIGRMR